MQEPTTYRTVLSAPQVVALSRIFEDVPPGSGRRRWVAERLRPSLTWTTYTSELQRGRNAMPGTMAQSIALASAANGVVAGRLGPEARALE